VSVLDAGYSNLMSMSVLDAGYSNLMSMSVPDAGYSSVIGNKLDIYVFIAITWWIPLLGGYLYL
jgi:hypothetical protein